MPRPHKVECVRHDTRCRTLEVETLERLRLAPEAFFDIYRFENGLIVEQSGGAILFDLGISVYRWFNPDIRFAPAEATG